MKTTTAMKTTIRTQVTTPGQDIQRLVNKISNQITPVWPLETFIATNPLSGNEDLPFEQALAKSPGYWNSYEACDQLSKVNREMIKWCGAFLDNGQGTIHMPHRDKGFLKGFLSLAVYDNELHFGLKKYKDWLKSLPESAEDVIKHCLEKLNVSQKDTETFLSDSLNYLPGWAGYVKWRSENHCSQYPVWLIDFLAVRLILTVIIWPEANKKKTKPQVFELRKITENIKRAERHYRQNLLEQLQYQLSQNNIRHSTPAVQAIFCIDVRSEPLRRHLEQQQGIETFGFAGFFGLPARFKPFEDSKTKDCLPALIKPDFQIEEKPCASQSQKAKRMNTFKAFLQETYSSFLDLKNQPGSSFSFIEASGFAHGLLLLLKTLFPNTSQRLFNPNHSIKTQFDLQQPISGFALDDQINYAASALKGMGLTQKFAKTVILCGHDATTENNPYASSLKCGACGGHGGLLNARLLAAMLNRTEVRQGLIQQQITIPDETFFIAASHDTCTHQISIDSRVDLSEEQTKNLEKFKQKALKAANFLRQEQEIKQSESSYADFLKTTALNPLDWSEVRPEWGLAGNASMIIAPRTVSQSINLQGRSFLHSYRWEDDENGTVLETILTAPMIVAQWINCQYLFSTLDNVAFGSGDKVTHNVIGGFGVMQGNGSDLMTGLPLQSVHYDEKQPFHIPQRLLTIIYAPLDRVKKIIHRQQKLQQLFFNGWVLLNVIEPQSQNIYQLDEMTKKFILVKK